MSEQQRTEQSHLNNQYFLNEGVMKLRIDSQRIIKEIECGLRGGVFVQRKIDGQIMEVFEQRGTPLMNDAGVQQLLNFLNPWFSPMTVQGNFTMEQYEAYIFEMDLCTSKQVIVNQLKWSIKDEDYNTVMDMIIMTAQAFFSRLIDDGERNSYAATVKVSESNTQQQGGGFLGLVR